MLLPPDLFKSVIKNTPLISIDILFSNYRKEYLLGKRKNQPAKGFWFVPGGRVLKDETLEEAFRRICINELGRAYDLAEASFNGYYQHFYQNNFFDDEFTTHYIVLSFRLSFGNDDINLPLDQHDDYCWLTKDSILNKKDVHKYTLDYFKDI